MPASNPLEEFVGANSHYGSCFSRATRGSPNCSFFCRQTTGPQSTIQTEVLGATSYNSEQRLLGTNLASEKRPNPLWILNGARNGSTRSKSKSLLGLDQSCQPRRTNQGPPTMPARPAICLKDLLQGSRLPPKDANKGTSDPALRPITNNRQQQNLTEPCLTTGSILGILAGRIEMCKPCADQTKT